MERFRFRREIRLKALHKKNLVKAKKINVDSIKDHLIPQVSSPKTPKYMFLFLDQAISREEHKSKDDFKKLEEEVENAEVVITILNGLLGSWDSFIQGMRARRK